MKKLLAAFFLMGPLFPKPAAAYTVVTTANQYMVENTTGTDPSGNACYDFQTRPTCSARITNLTISTAAIPAGSTQYIQNTNTPTTSTQIFNVSSGTANNLFVVGGPNAGIEAVPHMFNIMNDNTANQVMRVGTWGFTGLQGQNNVHWYRARGSIASPQATQSGDFFLSEGYRGYNGSAYTGSGASYLVSATENWTPTANGSQIQFSITPTGTVTNAVVITLSGLGVQVSTGNIFFLSGAEGIVGVTSGAGATAGNVGETIFSSFTATNVPTSGQWGNNAAITLSAGDWLVSYTLDLINNGATITVSNSGIGTVTGNDSTGVNNGDNGANANVNTVTGAAATSVPAWHTLLSGSQTYFLKINVTYSVATPLYRGRISAVRIR